VTRRGLELPKEHGIQSWLDSPFGACYPLYTISTTPSHTKERADRMKTLWIRDQYMQQILAGVKTTEVRVAYPNITRLEAGNELLLNDRHRYRIRRIATYSDFPTLLANEDPAAIAPGFTEDEILTALREIYRPEREALGAVALEIEPLPAERT